MQSFVKYKEYYNKRASACPLSVNDYYFVLHPKANSQATKLPFSEFMWTGPFVIVKTLPNNNYVVRKLKTNKTQTLHRITLRWYPTENPLPDIQVQQEEFQPDKEVEITNDDLYALAWASDFGNPQFYQKASIPTPETESVQFEVDNPVDPPDEAEETIQMQSKDLENTEAPELTPHPINNEGEIDNPTESPTHKNHEPTKENQKGPRGDRPNLRPNPTSNWRKDYVYYNRVEY